MGFEENILLGVKREYSKTEKWNLLIDALEKAELNRNLVQAECIKLKEQNRILIEENEELKDELLTYKADNITPKFVKEKTYTKLLKKYKQLETDYYNVCRELNQRIPAEKI